MKIVVYPHDLGMGGSQLVAIDLAAAARDLGHEVVVFGRPGVLCQRIEDVGLEFVESPDPGRRPSWRAVRALQRLVDDRGFEVIHGYEWPPSLEARLAVVGRSSAVAVSTVMSMAVAPFIPFHMPLVVGTAQIAAVERQRGRPWVTLIEPPVDLRHDSIERPLDLAGFRAAHGIPPDTRVVVCVARFARELKLEGLLTAARVVPTLADDVTMVLVGDGPERPAVEQAAADANAAAGRDAVVLTGQLDDVRPVFATAHAVLATGSSALRAMAYGKPIVVQGEQGFWKLLTPDTVGTFLWTGWYGVGDDAAEGPARLARELRPVLEDPSLAAELGRYSLDLVRTRFSLDGAGLTQVAFYDTALAARAGQLLRPYDDGVAAARYVRRTAHRQWQRRRGSDALDDFNAKPVAAEGASADDLPLVVFHAPVGFQDATSPERVLVDRLRQSVPVLWVDPPESSDPGVDALLGRSHLIEVAPRLWRLRITGLRGASEPARWASDTLANVAVDRACRRLGHARRVSVAARPTQSSFRLRVGRRIALAGDEAATRPSRRGGDRAARRGSGAWLGEADVVLADAASAAAPRGARLSVALPTGWRDGFVGVEEIETPGGQRSPVAAYVGPIDHGIDVAVLHDLAEQGIRVVAVGQLGALSVEDQVRWSDLRGHECFDWRPEASSEELRRLLEAASVGLAPFRGTAVIGPQVVATVLACLRSGLPVVMMDSEATRGLQSDVIQVAGTREDFVASVQHLMTAPPTSIADRCRESGRRHGWTWFADSLLRLILDPA